MVPLRVEKANGTVVQQGAFYAKNKWQATDWGPEEMIVEEGGSEIPLYVTSTTLVKDKSFVNSDVYPIGRNTAVRFSLPYHRWRLRHVRLEKNTPVSSTPTMARAQTSF